MRTIKIDAQNTKEEAEKLVKLIGGKRNFIKVELKKHNYSYNPETDQKTCLLCNYVLDRGWKCPNCNQLLE